MKLLLLSIFSVLIIGLVSAAVIDLNSNANVGGNSDSNIIIKSRANAEGQSTLVLSGIDVNTNLEVNINLSSNSQANVRLSNGRNAEIKIMPSTASEIAIVRIRLNVCSEENNCTIEIKEVSFKNEARAAYEIRAKKEYKVLGLFKAKGDLKVYVDVETGAIIEISRPWWTSISTEVKGNSASQISANA